jgi:mercuric ion binding protein
MMNRKAGRSMIKIAASLLCLLLIAAYIEAAEQQVVMEIEGMTCDLCSIAIKKALEEIKGVRSVKVSFEDNKAWITVDESVTDAALTDAVKKAGPYTARIIERKQAK